MNLKTFKKIAAQVAELEKADIEFDVSIRSDVDWKKDSAEAYFEPNHFTVTTLAQLSKIQAILGRAIRLKEGHSSVEIKGLSIVPCTSNSAELYNNFKVTPSTKAKLPTLKFHYPAGANTWYNFAITMITESPSEQMEGDVTYRFIGDAVSCSHCVPHTDPLYNYLDKGFFFTQVGTKKRSTIVTNELTCDTYLVMLLVWLWPAFAKLLPNQCFINANQARLLRVKMEKELPEPHRPNYDKVKVGAMAEYEKTANSNLLQRVADGKSPHATYNNIRFTQTSATYETISITAPELLTTLQSVAVFDDRTDIYNVIRDYIRSVIAELEREDLSVVPPPPPVLTNDEAKDKKALAKYNNLLEKEVVVEHKFTINGMEIVLKRTSENTRRYINGVMINKAEVEEVAYQSSCYSDADIYMKFVKSVSKMSLKWHKALSNGIAVKINAGLSPEDYRKAEAPLSSPRIKFIREDDVFKLYLGETSKPVPIKFNDCIAKLATLNRKTNNAYNTTGYGRRDNNWAKEEVIKVLKECCTFEKKETETVETEEPMMEEIQVGDIDHDPLVAGVQLRQVYDKKTKKPLTKKVKTKKNLPSVKSCLLSDTEAAFVTKMADDFQKQALIKSQKFLADAIRNTGAKLINFQGEEGYLVEGKLRKYVVNKRTNQVSNYDTKAYICIVEPGHQVSVGGDATASRLYALKNDSVLVSQIGTLRHG